MTVLPWGPGQYKIVSNGNVYWVDLNADEEAGRCDCPHHLYRGVVCKHIRAALDRASGG